MAATESEFADSRTLKLARFGLYVLIASLGFLQLPITIFGQNVVFTDLIFLPVFFFSIFALLIRAIRFRWHLFYWLLLFYIAALLLSCLFSANQRVSFFRLPAELYLVVLAVLTFNVTDSVKVLRRSMLAWLVGSSFAIIVGLITIALFYISPGNALLDALTYHYGAVPIGNYPRITATFASASMFCNYLNVALVLTIVAAIKGWFSKRFVLFLGCAIFLCSIFTISVGLGGIFLALGVLCFFISGSKSSALSFAGLAFSVVFAVIFLLLSVVSLEPTESSSVQIRGFTFAPSGRLLVWADAFQTFKKSPLTGHGLGLPVANVLFRNAEGTPSLLTDAHNSFLSVAAQDGILGLAALLMICAYILYRWRVGIKKTDRYATIGLGVAFLCSFVYQGLTGSFEEVRHLWVLMGIFLATDKIESRQDQNS